MSLAVLENQPLSFTPADDCACSDRWCWYVSQGDVTSFQVLLSEVTGENILQDSTFSHYLEGTADSNVLNELNDSGATFQTDGVTATSHTAVNITDSTFDIISVVNSETRLTLTSDTFPDGNEDYEILRWSLANNGYDNVNDRIAFTTAGSASFVRQYNLGLKASSLYKIVFTLNGYSAGDIEFTLGDTNLVISNTDLSVEGDTTYEAYITTAAAPATDYLEISGNDINNLTTSFDSVYLYEMSIPGVLVKDCTTSTEYYRETDGTSVTNPDGLMTSVAQIDLDWSTFSLSDGCYCVCLFDVAIQTDIIVNGDFAAEFSNTGLTESRGWEIENNSAGGWAISGGTATRTLNGIGLDYIKQQVQIDGSSCAFTLGWDDIGTTGNAIYRVLAEDSNGVQTVLLTETAILATTSPRTLSITEEDVKYIIFEGGNTAAQPTFKIDDVTLSQTDSACEDCITSQRICLDTDLECNITIAATNSNNLCCLDFENHDYTLRMRLPTAKKRFARYSDDRVQARDATGTAITQYAERVKIEELQTDFMSQEQHDALSFILMLDTIEINGQEYVKTEGEYSPNWVKNYSLAPVIVDVEKAYQYTINRNC